jgi:DHA2 family multidrug resistance protein
MDWFAIIALTIGIGAMQVVLEKGEREDWFETTYILVLTIAAVVGLIAFIWRVLVVENPVVDLSIMRHRTFAVGSLFNFILGFGLFASVFIIPVFAQNILGFTATDTGWLLMPGSMVTGLMMPIIGTLMKKRIPPLFFSAVGFMLFFLFTYDLSGLNLNVGPDDFFWPLIIRGVGLGMIFIPLTTLSLADLTGKEIPQGTAISNMIRQLGGSFGTAIMTTMISVRTKVHYDSLKDHVSSYDAIGQQRYEAAKSLFLSKGFSVVDASQQALASLQFAVYRQAQMITYSDAFLIVGGFFIVCIPMLLLFRGGKKNNNDVPIEMHME